MRTDSNPVDAAQRITWLTPLIGLNVPLILFVDSFFAPLVAPLPKGPHVTILPLEFGDLQTTKDILAAKPALPPYRTPHKDTLQYMCLMNAKAEIVAAAVPHSKTPYVAYIDSGISKIFKHPGTMGTLESLSFRDIPFLLIPGCHPMRPTSRDELARQINWTFCGGFFALPTERATEFAALHCRAVETFLAESRITWEVNVWTALFQGRNDILWYSADHNDTMLTAIPAANKIQEPAGP